MRRLFTIAAVVLAAGSVIFARSGMQAPGQEPEPEKKLIDLKSDNMGPIAPGDSVIFLVGNFAAQHNGAVITCDSAVRYSDMRIEFFGNVLINKNTTYIYGDRAEYNGELNEARVYSDIVKVVDGDATLYTYRFVFNTKENIGQFADGGVLINRDNRLESVRGYYYANTKDLVCVDRVEMRNDEYELKGDSVVYNMATDNAFFFENTNIWNKDGDYLYADRGAYDKADTLYRVTRNGYVLTEKQEMWSDSIDYFRAKDHVVLWRDIQIDDTEHKVLAFGDYGEYWKEPGDIFLTRRPSVVSYDLTQGDSLFMRADSMFLFTVNENARRRAEEKAAADSLARMGADSLQRPDSLGQHPDGLAATAGPEEGRTEPGLHPCDAADSLASTGGADSLAAGSGSDSRTHGSPRADSLRMADSLSVPGSLPDSLDRAADTLTVAQRKALLKEAARKANIHEFICSLPDGYDTMLTGNGANLSQGQRQLIAIARAAVADPPVMILDEATSSIDTRTEAIVQRGMDSLMTGRTVFVIAHRLSTVRNSDAIMVLDHGRIVERGDHEDLIRQHGLYYQLYTGAFELE